VKNLGFLMILAILMVTSCGDAFGSNDGHFRIPASSIRSAAYDPVLNCAIEQVHQHNGIYYGGHFNNDGHGHHGLHADDFCSLNNCNEISLHMHNGVHFAGHHGSDGHIGHGNGHGHGHH